MSDKTDWFRSAGYGMFIHWGAYSAGGRGEWVMNRERITKEQYIENFVSKFTAEDYDPAQWAAFAKKCGFGYVVLTTRHHDGFALWDSEINEFNAAKTGPCRDLIKPYVEALRAEGIKVGFYYSPASWTHPDYPGAYFRDWPGENDWADARARQRFIAYYRTELRELLTNYGKIDYLWFDGCIPENIGGNETLKMVRSWQPDIIVNNRLGEPFDIKTCEQTVNPAAEGQLWEACMTLNDSWGYTPGDKNWKTPYQVIALLLKCAAKGGNLLINVGPDPKGNIPAESMDILEEVGKWLEKNREAVTSDTRSPFSWSATVDFVCVRGSRIYLPLKFETDSVCWSELANNVLKVTQLDTGKELPFEKNGERLVVNGIEPQGIWTILAVDVEGTPEPATPQTTFWIPN
ncbi:MAG: alpha-L-fucosidase [Lentisphaeria bacterium]|nr:alpha-L-fucosidase [Lentisphaeria bacterium]